jgi:hypothetical protein
MGVDVLPLLSKKLDLEVTPLGDPAMKMPMKGGRMSMPSVGRKGLGTTKGWSNID